MKTIALFALCIFLSTTLGCYRNGNDEVLIVLSFDAFAAVYRNLQITPNMERFCANGVCAKYMVPRFPTKTFPNHFSMATGCNTGTHGVTGNELFDTTLGELKYGYPLFHHNSKRCLPVWTANQMNGRTSGCMMWPGCDFPYRGISNRYFQKLDEKMSWVDRMSIVMKWIDDPFCPPNLIMWYVEQPDSEGHAFSPNSDQVRNMIIQVDYFVNELEKEIIRRNLTNRVNLIIVSDHGMSTVPIATNVIDLRKFMTPHTYKFSGSSPVLQVIPRRGQGQRVWTQLKRAASQPNSHFRVYRPQTVPAHWKVRNDRRMGPIMAYAESPYAFQDLVDLAKWFQDKRKIPITNTSLYGVHGYACEEDMNMTAIFMAKGKWFQSGNVLDPFDNIELYSLICNLLGITCPRSEATERKSIWTNLLKSLEVVQSPFMPVIPAVPTYPDISTIPIKSSRPPMTVF